MKKALNISIGGRVFNIEEDAAEKLQTYIHKLEEHYLKEDDGREIMNDIEYRIADLFNEYKTAAQREAVISEDVDRAIEIMGKPNDIFGENEENNEVPPTVPQQTKNRKLYRDVDNSYIGGVAAGLAAWLNIPAALVRVLFIIFTFYYGAFILIYIILWIVLPGAVTPAQKLEMKGEPVNIPNIAKTNRQNKNNMSDTLAKVATTLARIITLIIFVITLIVTCITIAIAICAAFNPDMLHPNDFMTLYAGIPSISILLIILMPLLLVIWACSKILFPTKKISNIVPISFLIIWLVSLITLICTAIIFKYNPDIHINKDFSISSTIVCPDINPPHVIEIFGNIE